MKKFQCFTLSCLLLIVWFFPSSAFACACCAERGHYSIRTAKPSDDELEELRKVKFQNAELYNPSGENDAIKGISPLNGSFSVASMWNNGAWTFNFTDDRQKTGKLNLAKPLSMVEYMVDLPNANSDSSGAVKLYKEWRFKYRVQNATGIFKNGFAPSTEYFLVLQGYGNACTSAEDFKQWRLEISGKKADFTFFGNLSAAR